MDDRTREAARETALLARLEDALREVLMQRAHIDCLVADLTVLRQAQDRTARTLQLQQRQLTDLSAFAARAAAQECSPHARMVLEHVAALASDYARLRVAA